MKKIMKVLSNTKVMLAAFLIFTFGFFLAGVTEWLKTGLTLMIISAIDFLSVALYYRPKKKKNV